MSSLRGRVAVVTGASRGVGKGIALALGEAGATVYVTGRSDAGGTTEGLPGTVGETADAVMQRGGHGIGVRCDHTADAEVEALFARVAQELVRLLETLDPVPALQMMQQDSVLTMILPEARRLDRLPQM